MQRKIAGGIATFGVVVVVVADRLVDGSGAVAELWRGQCIVTVGNIWKRLAQRPPKRGSEASEHTAGTAGPQCRSVLPRLAAAAAASK